MKTLYLTSNDIVESLKISKPNLYRMVKEGSFPAPTRIGKRKSRWLVSRIQEWLENNEKSQHGSMPQLPETETQ